jgi:hypothetical protein
MVQPYGFCNPPSIFGLVEVLNPFLYNNGSAREGFGTEYLVDEESREELLNALKKSIDTKHALKILREEVLVQPVHEAIVAPPSTEEPQKDHDDGSSIGAAIAVVKEEDPAEAEPANILGIPPPPSISHFSNLGKMKAEGMFDSLDYDKPVVGHIEPLNGEHPLNRKQSLHSMFPIGCQVQLKDHTLTEVMWVYFSLTSMNFVYGVGNADGSYQNLSWNDLSFAPNCPVHFRGKPALIVSLCQGKYSVICKDSVCAAVPPSDLKYRFESMNEPSVGTALEMASDECVGSHEYDEALNLAKNEDTDHKASAQVRKRKFCESEGCLNLPPKMRRACPIPGAVLYTPLLRHFQGPLRLREGYQEFAHGESTTLYF